MEGVNAETLVIICTALSDDYPSHDIYFNAGDIGGDSCFNAVLAST